MTFFIAQQLAYIA